MHGSHFRRERGSSIPGNSGTDNDRDSWSPGKREPGNAFPTCDEKKCSLISVWQWGFDSFILWSCVHLSASNSKNTETGMSVNPCIILNSSMRSAL